MAVTPASFRQALPEFGDTEKYPDVGINFWLDQAGVALAQGIPSAQIDLATTFYVAHNLTLGVRGATGAGDSFAMVSSKSVGSVSKSYDTSSASYQGAGLWNGTSYGQRLYQLLRAYSTGPLYRPSSRAAALGRSLSWPYR